MLYLTLAKAKGPQSLFYTIAPLSDACTLVGFIARKEIVDDLRPVV